MPLSLYLAIALVSVFGFTLSLSATKKPYKLWNLREMVGLFLIVASAIASGFFLSRE